MLKFTSTPVELFGVVKSSMNELVENVRLIISAS